MIIAMGALFLHQVRGVKTESYPDTISMIFGN